MLKNVGENILKKFAVIFFYTMDIKITIFNPKFYQKFLASLLISDQRLIVCTLTSYECIAFMYRMNTTDPITFTSNWEISYP